MSSEKKILRELEAGAQPHIEIRKSNKPRAYRVYAGLLGLFLFSFGLATGVAVSQQLPITKAIQTETLQKYLSQALSPDFVQNYLSSSQGQQGQQTVAQPETQSETSAEGGEKAVDKAAGTSSTQQQSLWQPSVGSTWNYQLYTPPTAAQLANPTQFNVWGIDLFDTPNSTIQTIQAAGSKVICYFSGGSYEPNRPDSKNFTSSDRGKALNGWPGEYWLKYKSTNVRNIMKARLDLAAAKGCNGVDPDNMDAYNNDNGWRATQQDTIDYITFLSTEAASRGLSIGLKNSLEVVSSSVVSMVQYSVNEACSQYTECGTLAPFINAGKPVFNVEYPKGDTSNTMPVSKTARKQSCSDASASQMSKIIKNRILDDWIQSC